MIEYYVHANKDGQNTQTVGPFSFTVADWETVQSVSLESSTGGVVLLDRKSVV